MRDLHEMNFGQRAMMTVVIVVVVLLLLAIIGYLSGRWEAEAAPTPVPISPYETRLLALEREALDNSYRSKIEQLISVWLKDETGQPQRAVNGANQARKAYAGAMAEIERREKLLPPQPTTGR